MGDAARMFSPQGGVRIVTSWRVHPLAPGTALPLDDEPLTNPAVDLDTAAPPS
jgi:hypothetical protein